ncbi:MAG: single-stranded-DNA-specific exonuclease RecJ [Oscillospiraceae bacterium]|nr:single-stranded-DNA-specific exonuclease RecJ [Oscillospiraceae bacterium]
MRFDNWDIGSFDRDTAVEFCRNGVNPLVSVFLASRGITDLKDVSAAIGNEQTGLFDPLLMADMDKAVVRINKAVSNGERIAVYGDYDVDGMTSCAILSIWLDSKNADFEIYIPERFNEGYGLNNSALSNLKEKGITLVITVDCGITAIEEAEFAKSIGLDLVITDHHECRGDLPDAVAVVDPKRPDCKYPYKSLAGVGVAFKLICALENDYQSDTIIKSYCDLVALGTVADVMPVVGENRELIKLGLDILNRYPRPGFRSLLQEIGITPGTVTSSTIGFTLAPRLNAAGRMGQSELSVKLLLSKSYEDSEELAVELCRLNSERRSLEQEIYDEAIAMLSGEAVPCEPIVLAQKGWYQGVTGIIAAKIAERYCVPAVIISIDEDGTGRGSCRSFGSFVLYDALCSCEDILLNYGGHEMAAGVTVAEENIDELRTRIVKYYNDNVTAITKPGLKLDFEVEKPELLTIQNIEALEHLEPFGNGNPSPCLCILGAVLSSAQSIGDGKHSKLKIGKSGKNLDCIFFSVPTEDLGVSEGMTVDLAFEPQVNEFRGRSNVQLQLHDIRASKEQTI